MSDLFEQAVLDVLRKHGVLNGDPVPAPTGTAQANTQPIQDAQPADPWANQGAPANGFTPGNPGPGGVAQFAGPVQSAPVQAAPYQPQQQVAPQMAATPGPALKQFQPPAPGQYSGNGRYGPTQISVGVPNAPMCQHGLPAAYVVGKKQNGQDFRVFRCAAVALPGDGWKSKCQFNQYVNNR